MPRFSIPSQAVSLSTNQKTTLSIIARQGWEIATRAGLTELSFDEWRHNEAISVVGLPISKAANGDYLKLLAHFRNLAGDSKGALDALGREDSDPHRQGMHALRKALATRNLDEAYAERLCQDAYKVSLAQATPQQLRNLRFTVINRRKAQPQES